MLRLLGQFSELPQDEVRVFLAAKVESGWEDGAPPSALLTPACPEGTKVEFELPV